ncbi:MULTISPECIES: hypothetical protein [Hyphomonas]|uniref:HEAT repeat domain-containing protein n=1 Tax=Hyphomonas adhaerens TaxID=81029 RepID=A0A3B9H2F6_9PROT|nr:MULTISPECIES: hypothetical protein [Hyphomonas]MBB39591.1 hypothetical protein [Hyphomonas sp.]HAE28882.1 hypothetical protein [Hyphomonas adhaerens]|tara:strand:+ start:285 stop:806 length:522 start_codon:yes stop_codon:yes gene_type:complete
MTEPHALKNQLAAFDRKSPSVLTEAAATYGSGETYFDMLADLSADEDDAVSSGATRLIKHHAENGEALAPDQCVTLANHLDRITAWDAQLHICQSARLLPYPDKVTDRLLTFARPLLAHRRPFLRAWSLDLVCHLAERDPGITAEAEKVLALAEEDPAASVRARARNLGKAKR